MDKLHINYINNQIYILKDKILKTESKSEKEYYQDIIENLENTKKILENE